MLHIKYMCMYVCVYIYLYIHILNTESLGGKKISRTSSHTKCIFSPLEIFFLDYNAALLLMKNITKYISPMPKGRILACIEIQGTGVLQCWIELSVC